MRKKHNSTIKQMAFSFEEVEENQESAQPMETVRTSTEQEGTNQMREASPAEYLLDWGKRHNYPELEFLVPRGKYQGKYGVAEVLWEESVFISKGYEKWLEDCTNGIPEWMQYAAAKARQLEMGEVK